VIVLEIIGLTFFYYYVPIELIYLVFLFLIDAVCASFSHFFHGKSVILINEKFLLEHDVLLEEFNLPKEANIRIKEKSLKWITLWKWFFNLIIIFVAIFKILGFYFNFNPGLHAPKLNGISLSVILIYIIVAWLHIRSTGYFVYSQIYYSMVNQKVKRHKYTNDNYRTVNQDINLSDYFVPSQIPGAPAMPLERYLTTYNNREKEHNGKLFNDARTRNHTLRNDILSLHGILTDIDIQDLIRPQDPAMNSILFFVLRYVQLRTVYYNDVGEVRQQQQRQQQQQQQQPQQ
jgi:hypothetical protein